METLRLKVDELGEKAIDQAAALLRRGELVAFPTETVYGLGAVLWNVAAVRKIFAVKGRPLDNPLIVHVDSIAMALPLVKAPEEKFLRVVRRFWPGPLTVVVEHPGNVPAEVTAGLPTVALRMPEHFVALQLIRKVGQPLVAPSANRSGKPSPTRAAHVLEDFDGLIAAVLDAGPTHFGIESTVLLLTTTPPRILRPGVVSREELAAVLGEPVEESTEAEQGQPLAPGMKYRHYAPAVPVILFSDPEKMRQALRRVPNTSTIVVLALPEWRALLESAGATFRELSERTLYEHFRTAERERRAAVWILVDPKVQQRSGLYNRILKAASSTSPMENGSEQKRS